MLSNVMAHYINNHNRIYYILDIILYNVDTIIMLHRKDGSSVAALNPEGKIMGVRLGNVTKR